MAPTDSATDSTQAICSSRSIAADAAPYPPTRASGATSTPSKRTSQNLRVRSSPSSGETSTPAVPGRQQELRRAVRATRGDEEPFSAVGVLDRDLGAREQETAPGPRGGDTRSRIAVASRAGERPRGGLLAGDQGREHFCPVIVSAFERQRHRHDVRADERARLESGSPDVGDQRRVQDTVARDAASSLILRDEHGEPAE